MTRACIVLKVMQLGLIEQYKEDLFFFDNIIDDFTSLTLCFDQDYQGCHYKACNQIAHSQSLLGIKLGRMRIISLERVTPGAFFGALGEFTSCFYNIWKLWHHRTDSNALQGLT
jgi:hypothetical protein